MKNEGINKAWQLIHLLERELIVAGKTIEDLDRIRDKVFESENERGKE